MDIVLINPSQKNVYGHGVIPPYPPLGLLYLGAVLLNGGYSVEVIDIDIDFPNVDQFTEFIKETRPAVVGFTAVTPSFNDAVRLAGIIKRIYKPFIIFGGPHTTAIPFEVLKESNIDAVVVGEGEETILEFMNNFKTGNMIPVPGLIIKKGSRILKGARREFIKNLDKLPFPAWSLLKHQRKYSPPDALTIPVATLLTSRGCPYRCTFCQAPKLWGRNIRRRSVDNVIEEIRFLISEYNIKEIHIADDDFSHSEEWTMDFLSRAKKEIYKVRFLFMNGLRIDNVNRVLLEEMKKTGFVNVGFGVESGVQSILNRVKKGLKIQEIKKKFRIAKKLGFKTWAFFILGLPGDNKRTIRETIKFSILLDPDFAKYFFLVPYPGTEVYEEFRSRGMLRSNDFSKYGLYGEPVYELDSLSQKDIKKMLLVAYLRFYLRPLKILKILFKIRSFTELRLNFRAILFLVRKLLLFFS